MTRTRRHAARPAHTSQPPGRRRRLLDIVVTGCDRQTGALLRRVARHVLRRSGRARGAVEIAVVSDSRMRRAHKRWLGETVPTDVLTFDLGGRHRSKTMDGLIMVGADAARRAARRCGTSGRAELALYVAHGCLHLIGYDDRRMDDARRMHRREDTLLSELRLGPLYNPASRLRRPGRMR